MTNRYLVTQLPDQSAWAILDRELWGYCALPDDTDPRHPNLLPLQWKGRPAAEAWLRTCYHAWENNLVPTPQRWRPYPEKDSPWDPFGNNSR
jgi:hypothetical protein